MKLSANFQLSELVKSQVAERKGIPNNPSPAHIDNLKALCVNVLQPIRSHFDSPVLISSGYRSAELMYCYWQFYYQLHSTAREKQQI
jgi:zinc D-Ala-D-Ala carboxypeptidase